MVERISSSRCWRSRSTAPGSNDLGQLAQRRPAERIHLPQPVLGGDVPLRKHQVVKIGGADVGHTLRVAEDADRRREALDAHLAVNLRQRSVQLKVAPSSRAQDQYNSQRQRQAGDARQRAVAPGGGSKGGTGHEPVQKRSKLILLFPGESCK